MEIYFLILLIALCAFIPRYIPWLVLADKSLPPRIEKTLGTVPAAVLSAIVVPIVFYVEEEPSLTLLINPYFIASIVTFVITIATKRILLASTLGMILFALLKMY